MAKKVRVYKPLWDYMDKQEGKEEGSSFKNFKKEAKSQGYEAEDSSQGGKVSYYKPKPKPKPQRYSMFNDKTIRRLG